MSEPDVTVVRVIPRPGQTEAVLEVMREIVPTVHTEDGCLLYAVHVEANGDIWFIEKWESRAAADHHGAHSSVIPVLQERTTHLMVGPPEIHSLVPFPIGDAKGAL